MSESDGRSVSLAEPENASTGGKVRDRAVVHGFQTGGTPKE